MAQLLSMRHLFWGCRILKPAAFAYLGLCQLFELYFLNAFVTFSGIPVADVVSQDQSKASQACSVPATVKKP
jgi:hypothetical protein